MRKVRTVLVALVVLNVALLLAGGGKSERAVPSGRTRVGLVFDVGGLGDKSFNDSAYRGLTRAEAEFDIETRTIQPGDGADRESAIRELGAAGYDLVIGVGFVFTDDLRKAAGQFPKVSFVCIDYSVIPGQPPPPKNLLGARFREEEGSFLVGALSGLVSKSKKVGFVGGMQIPLIRKFEAGYVAGVHYVCPTCKVFSAYAGTTPQAFADPSKGKELALAQYRQGADIIYHASGKTGAGVFNAAREQKRFAIGVDSDQYHEAPCCVLTSMTKGVDVAVFESIQAAFEGRFVGGLRELGLREGGVDYVYDARNRARIGHAARLRVEEIRQQIIDGKIEVPQK